MLQRTLLVVGLVLPCVASAQIPLIEGLVDRFTDVNVQLLWGRLHPRPDDLTTGGRGAPPRSGGLRGFALEFAFGIADVPYPHQRAATRQRTASDTSFVPKTVKVTHAAGRADTTRVLEVVVKEPEDTAHRLAYLDLGIGYSEVWGFAAVDTTIDLKGSIRELPSLTLYATLWPDNKTPFAPYAGLRGGLAQLHQASLYDLRGGADSTRRFPVSAQAFQMGAVAGVAIALGDYGNLFVESAYTRRFFGGLTIESATGHVPARFPRDLNFSGLLLSFGLQVGVPERKKS